MVLYCAQARWAVMVCEYGSCWKYFQQRCPVSKMCDNCQIQRRRVILARLHSKYEENIKSIQAVVLWTIGSNLKNTDKGRKTLAVHWKYFRARMNKKAEWDPLFRVVEAGSQGRYLHIHFLNNGFLSHPTVLGAWRDVTKNKSNVNFSDKKLPPKYAFRYAAKYLSKDASKFTFLGKFYGIRKMESVPECKEHGTTFIYHNTMEDKRGFMGQTTISQDEGFI